MKKNITYFLGAGASANALPVVEGLKDRFKIFCDHFFQYLNANGGRASDVLAQALEQQRLLCTNIESHYTVDTYAKKLFLQNPNLSSNQEYKLLTKYLSAYFLYEQLRFDLKANSNNYILKEIDSPVDNEGVLKEQIKKITKDFDYRYDSLFASILEFNDEKRIQLPENINVVSWNYDFQIEKAYMNFTRSNLDEAIKSLNVYGSQENLDYKEGKSSLIKLNGTAAFSTSGSFGDLFDFKNHQIDNDTFRVFEEILLSKRSKEKNAMRFAWEDSQISKHAIMLAKNIILKSDIIVIIGYSFPYFNREVDREIFSSITKYSNKKIYIQLPIETIDSVAQRFAAVTSAIKPAQFIELDQFLIPNEF